MNKSAMKRILTVLLMVLCTFMLTACDTSTVEAQFDQIFRIALTVATYVIEAALFFFIVRLIIK